MVILTSAAASKDKVGEFENASIRSFYLNAAYSRSTGEIKEQEKVVAIVT